MFVGVLCLFVRVSYLLGSCIFGVLCLLGSCVGWGLVFVGVLCLVGSCVCWGLVFVRVLCLLGSCVC